MRFSERYKLQKEFEDWIKTVDEEYKLANCLMNGIAFLSSKFDLIPKGNLTNDNKTYEYSYEIKEC